MSDLRNLYKFIGIDMGAGSDGSYQVMVRVEDGKVVEVSHTRKLNHIPEELLTRELTTPLGELMQERESEGKPNYRRPANWIERQTRQVDWGRLNND